MALTYLPSQSDRTKSTNPIPYTTSPLKLFWYDIVLFGSRLYAVFGIVLPLTPWRSGALDELYPSAANIFAIAFHTVLIFAQLAFLLLIPLFFTFPLGAFVAYVAGFLILNKALCRILNGPRLIHHSKVNLDMYPKHYGESWVFINGVAVGQSWLQANIDRLSMTFGRPITAVHNLTYGIIFDVLECLIQRDFSYATTDTRQGYRIVKEHLTKFQKVVLILHSQGGIEGCQILDWLLADLPEDLNSKLEIYTFGNAANHFNNPIRVSTPSTTASSPPNAPNPAPERVIRHIEHYANSRDPVSRFGVLNFIYPRVKDNRFVGQLFEREGSGHQLNQHYLDNMFTLDPRTMTVLNDNPFMNSVVDIERVMNEADAGIPNHLNGYATRQPGTTVGSECRVKDLSRLWKYRNGLSPED